jgi:hypothetical protein
MAGTGILGFQFRDLFLVLNVNDELKREED